MRTSPIRTAATLGVLVILLLLGLVWGWSQTTMPFPKFGADDGSSATACSPRGVKKGKDVTPAMVLVDVSNAGVTEGLAGEVMDGLTERGFAKGTISNAPRNVEVDRIAIWADDPDSPAAQLVASQFYDAPISKPVTDLGNGIVVVVGDDFVKLAKGKDAVTAQQWSTICSPSS